jgi:23S rRNA (adenine2030-N6)-methyltransferase
MNYRHAFHAGNFADIVKHAALTLILREMTATPGPLAVIDTHAGAGAYDLSSEMAQRSGEAQIDVLMADPDAPAALAPLKQAAGAMPKGLYPGSPYLIGAGLRRGDRYVACELRADDHALLAQTLKRWPNAQALKADGYRTVAEQAGPGKLLVLIDPPFERPDDYEQAARALHAILRRNRTACVAVWLPLKDLETFDAFLRMVEPQGALVAEVRLRPLIDPMKMNGCALVIAGPPPGLAGPLADACEWVASKLGDAGGSGKVWRLGA